MDHLAKMEVLPLELYHKIIVLVAVKHNILVLIVRL